MTKIGCKRTARPTPLKRRTKLQGHKGLKPMSDKAKAENKVWQKIKKERMEALREKFGFVPCELCLKPTNSASEIDYPEAHHENGKRRGENNNPANCRILHRTCNQWLEENFRSVPSLL